MLEGLKRHRDGVQDLFGVPESMFGRVPEDFYCVAGRIVMVATLVEDRTLMVLWSLDDATQDTHAGKSASAVRQEVKQRIVSLAPILGSDLVSQLNRILEDLEHASRRRNALVHSLWPNPSEELAQGWRSIRGPKGSEPPSEIAWTLTSLDELKRDLAERVELQERLTRLANRVWAKRGNVPWNDVGTTGPFAAESGLVPGFKRGRRR